MKHTILVTGGMGFIGSHTAVELIEAGYDVVIVGGGPAGLTAGIYAARAGKSTAIIERGMIGGQMIDIQSENKKIGLETLKYIHSHKTGKLIKLPIEIACIIANLEKDKREVLEEYADLIGLAFQVKDDILDVEGTFEDLGKPVGSDVDLHKATYPSILGMEESKKILNETVERAKKIIHNMFGEEKGKILISLADFIRERKS